MIKIHKAKNLPIECKCINVDTSFNGSTISEIVDVSAVNKPSDNFFISISAGAC